MSLISETGDNLDSEWRILQRQWENTRQQWQDAVAEAFEREFWQQLETEVPYFLKSISDLDEVLEQALRHTDDDR